MWNRQEMNVPTMSLDLRIAPLVKQVVQKMLLQEEDVRDAIEQAVTEAVKNFNWREQLQEEVSRTIKDEVTRLSSSLVHSIFWDDEFSGQFRKAVAKALAEN